MVLKFFKYDLSPVCKCVRIFTIHYTVDGLFVCELSRSTPVESNLLKHIFTALRGYAEFV
jgi:hypothetical protein